MASIGPSGAPREGGGAGAVAGALGVPFPVFVACALTFALYVAAYMRLPLVPVFARDLGATTVQAGMINAGFMLAATLLSVPLGLVSDRLGRRRLILAGIAIGALTSFLLVAAKTPSQVGAIYVLAGVGLACFSPAMMSYVGDVSPPSFLGRTYGWYTSALYLGMAVGPGLGGAVAAYGFRTAFFVSGAAAAAAIVVGAMRMPSSPPVFRPATSNILSDLREITRSRAVLACWLVTFFSTFAWGSLFAFFPLFARDSGISLANTGLVFTTQAAANALSRIPIGHLADRTGRRELYIFFGNFLFALAIMLVGWSGGRLLPLYAIFTAVGATMAATFTAIGAVLSEAVPMRVRGLAMGGYNTCIYGGFAVSAATLGAVIEGHGYPAAFGIAGALCAAATLLFAAIVPLRGKSPLAPKA